MASTQFKSTDTTPWWIGFGNGSDGAYSSVGNATDAPVDSSCSGTVGATSLTATNASFANGKPILIHQSRGTGAGAWELNQIASYVAGTITLVSPLKNTYTDSGASQAQVIQLKQYSSFTQNSGHTLTAKGWDGNVGGIIAFLCNGDVSGSGTISFAGKGFIGGNPSASSGNPSPQDATQGEGTGGAGIAANGSGTATNGSNGNGGGGGRTSGTCPTAGGGGGGNGAAGSNGTLDATGSGGNVGSGGTTAGNASLTSMVFGGGGGAPLIGNLSAGGTGANGGGLLLMIGKNLDVSSMTIPLTGNNGVASTGAGRDSGGGGGAGGSALLKAQVATLGTNKITASAGSGANGGESAGGNGGVGRIHLDYLLSYSGTTTPTIDVTQDDSLSDRKSSMLLNLL